MTEEKEATHCLSLDREEATMLLITIDHMLETAPAQEDDDYAILAEGFLIEIIEELQEFLK